MSKYAKILQARIVYYTCEQDCTSLQSHDGLTVTASPVQQLKSSQEEANTRIILHCLYTSQNLSDCITIVVRSPDTDVFVLLLAYFDKMRNNPLLFDTGNGNNRHLISINCIAPAIGDGVVQVLLGLHAFTGSDCTSAFIRKGKRAPLMLICRNSQFLSAFQHLGTNAQFIDSQTQQVLEHSVCALYGIEVYRDTDVVRADIFQSRYSVNSLSCGTAIDLSLLQPCHRALTKHILRAKYVTAVWKNSHIPFYCSPLPAGSGWKLNTSWSVIQLSAENLMNTAKYCTMRGPKAKRLSASGGLAPQTP